MAVHAENELPMMQKIPLCTSFFVALRSPLNNLDFRRQGDNETTRHRERDDATTREERRRGRKERRDKRNDEEVDGEIPVTAATLI